MKGYIGAYPDCLYHKFSGERQPGMLHSTDKTGQPFHMVHADHLGSLAPSGQIRYKYLLVAIDEFTKFAGLEPHCKLLQRHARKLLVL